MRKFVMISLVALILMVLAALYLESLYYEDTGDDASVRIPVGVAHGSTFKQVQAELVEKGIVTRPTIFRWAAYLTRRETKIKSGRYLFRRGESVAAVLGKLVAGEVNYSRTVIPEGLMASEVAAILQKEADVDSAAFMRATADSALIAELKIMAPSLEGYLFPDTYLFDWPIEPEDAIRRLVYRFRRIYEAVACAVPDTIGLTVNEIVTLASIVQAEAGDDSEMPQISAVFHNRLKAGWKLEADPTVAYALGGVRRRIWYRDLEVDSPYNTYKVRGLPPGAICNPGRSAIEAAVMPVKGCLDFYFVADGTGRHRFNSTYFDHLRDKHLFRYGAVPPEMREKSYLEAIGMETGGAGGDTLKPCAPDSAGTPGSGPGIRPDSIGTRETAGGGTSVQPDSGAAKGAPGSGGKAGSGAAMDRSGGAPMEREDDPGNK